MNTINATQSVDPAAQLRPDGNAPDRPLVLRIFCGRPQDPRWARPALWAILLLAGALYAWSLGRNGSANDYYAATVISGTKSLKAWFYGSLDAQNFITVDKPPLSTWVMVLSARIFGYSTWSMLLPQAAAGVATVGLLYSAVRRSLGHSAATIAALATALSPIAVAVNRWNTPDAIMVFAIVAAAWAMTIALESGRSRWVLAAMAFVGIGFNAKMMQAWMVVPALGIAYLFFAPPTLLKRIRQLALAAVVLLVVSFPWMVAVELTPVDSRPYVGGSKNNSVFELLTGHNGFARIFSGGGGGGGAAPAGGAGGGLGGAPGGGVGGGLGGAPGGSLGGGAASGAAGAAPIQPTGPGGGPGFSGESGVFRLFNNQMGDQISWLLIIAAIGLIAGLIITRKNRRTDMERSSFVLWGIWLTTHALLFSFSSGIIHEYYTSAMAPAVGALVGGGVVLLWRASRESHAAAITLAVSVAATGIWSAVLLRRVPTWNPWLAPLVVLVALGAAVVLLVLKYAASERASAGGFALAVATAAILLAPAAYATTPLTHVTRDPTAGPSSAESGPGQGGGGAPGQGAGQSGPANLGQRPAAQSSGNREQVGGTGTAGEINEQGRNNQIGQGNPPPLTSSDALQQSGAPANPASPQNPKVDEGLIDYLVTHRSGERWLAAANGSFTAAPIIIATGGEPVMAMGGFGGNDPTPTLDDLREYVSNGEVRFVVLGNSPGAPGGQGGPGGGGQTGSQGDGFTPNGAADGQGQTNRDGRSPNLPVNDGQARSPGDGQAGTQPAGRQDAQGNGPGNRSERDQWVAQACHLVSASEYAFTDTNSNAAGVTTQDEGTGQSGLRLYDCAGAKA